MAQAAAGGGGMTSLPPAPAADSQARHLHAVARTASGHVSAAAGDGRHATRRTIDPAVLTAKAEAGQPAGHKPQLSMRLPPPDWLPDSYGYRFHKQFS